MERCGDGPIDGHISQSSVMRFASSELRRHHHEEPSGFVGWNIPIDPLFAPFADLPAFKIVLQKLAARAA
jgi:hypothetical protein